MSGFVQAVMLWGSGIAQLPGVDELPHSSCTDIVNWLQLVKFSNFHLFEVPTFARMVWSIEVVL